MAGGVPNQIPFVVGKLGGELGNQMFQVAATVNLALEHGFEPFFPDFAECPDWNLAANYRHVFWRLSAQSPPGEIEAVYEEGCGIFPIPATPNMQLLGFFQTEGYFEQHKEQIVESSLAEHLHTRLPG